MKTDGVGQRDVARRGSVLLRMSWLSCGVAAVTILGVATSARHYRDLQRDVAFVAQCSGV